MWIMVCCVSQHVHDLSRSYYNVFFTSLQRLCNPGLMGVPVGREESKNRLEENSAFKISPRISYAIDEYLKIG